MGVLNGGGVNLGVVGIGKQQQQQQEGVGEEARRCKHKPTHSNYSRNYLMMFVYRRGDDETGCWYYIIDILWCGRYYTTIKCATEGSKTVEFFCIYFSSSSSVFSRQAGRCLVDVSSHTFPLCEMLAVRNGYRERGVQMPYFPCGQLSSVPILWWFESLFSLDLITKKYDSLLPRGNK